MIRRTLTLFLALLSLCVLAAAQRNPLQGYAKPANIRRAALDLRQELRPGGVTQTDEEYRTHFRDDGVVTTLGMSARFGVVVDQHPVKTKRDVDVEHGNDCPYWRTFETTKATVHATAKAALASPAGIRVANALAGDAVVTELKRQGVGHATRIGIEMLIPFLDGTLPKETQQRLAAMDRAWQPFRAKREAACSESHYDRDACMRIWDARERLLEDHGLAEGTFRDYEWTQRQRRSGGQERVQALLAVMRERGKQL